MNILDQRLKYISAEHTDIAGTIAANTPFPDEEYMLQRWHRAQQVDTYMEWRALAAFHASLARTLAKADAAEAQFNETMAAKACEHANRILARAQLNEVA